MIKRTLYIILILILPACSAFYTEHPDSSTATSTQRTKTTQAPPIEVLTKAEQLLRIMTLEEKIGQLFIIRPDSLERDLTEKQISNPKAYGVTEMDRQMIADLKRYHIGGVALFKKNIVSPEQLMDFIDEMKINSDIPLFVSIDEEGGSVARIANAAGFDVIKYPSMQAIGLTKDLNNAKDVGLTIGSYLKQYGFNLDFAPVADVNTNPKNIVIGNRSFGSDPVLVGEMVVAAIEGFHKAGVMSCIKHFPGHGDTKEDTHKGFVSTRKTWDELKQSELIPFVKAFRHTDMVMISHITAPNITSDGLPSSLSQEMIEGKLRKELEYDGVVITDSMEMGAIAYSYTSAEAAVKSILGGADIILMPENFAEAYTGVHNAVTNGTISIKRIDESILRILSLKEKYGLLN